MRNAATAGGGFVHYIWPKPGAGDQPKLSYAEMIPGTNMWIGTGVYLDNIDAYQQKMATEIDSLVAKRTTTMVLVSGVIFAAIIALCLIIALGIVRSLKEMIKSLQDIAEGEGDLTKRIKINERDEIAQASQGIQEVNENVSQSSAVAAQITEDIAVVNHSAGVIANSSEQVKVSADDLKGIVGRFKV